MLLTSPNQSDQQASTDECPHRTVDPTNIALVNVLLRGDGERAKHRHPPRYASKYEDPDDDVAKSFHWDLKRQRFAT